MIYVFIGPPGVGKGTIADMIVDNYNAKQISMGDLLRHEIKEETDIGKKIKNILAEGKLVDSELTYKLIYPHIEKAKKQYDYIILDGFPRNMEQAEILERESTNIDNVVYFNASEDVIVKRLSNRRMCGDEKCKKIYNLITMPPKIDGKCDDCNANLIQREDDKPEVIRDRYRLFKNTTEKVIEYYKIQDKVIEINAERSPEKIYQDTVKTLNLK